jgi:hypothetical protein
MSLKIFVKSFLFICLMLPSFAGEPGTSDDEQVNSINEIIRKNVENSNFSKKIEPILKKTTINLPKNPISQLFNQTIGQKINTKKASIVGNCLPMQKLQFCKVVKPKKNSSHFNKYFYYLSSENKVNAIIAFSNKRVGNISICRSMIESWARYFENFDLLNTTSDSNKDQLFLEHTNIKKTEISMSCQSEQFRDINSFFSLKFFKDES